jgi:uncharacterized protein (TIGR00255 family)
MIRSMTGYGGAKGLSGKLEISVEIKSVNNRFLDCGVKLPRLYSFAEESVKALVQSQVQRGKVDVYINIDSSKADDVTVKLNAPLLEGYKEAFKRMNEEFQIGGQMDVTGYSRISDIFIIEKKEVDAQAFTADLGAVVSQALSAFNSMREREGGRLKEDILLKLEGIARIRQLILKRSPQAVTEYREKLLKRMKEVLEGADIDEARILTEAALFADKTDVDEELVRLASHISQIRELFTSGSHSGIGRKLDFIVQELNREANTIGSKCSDLEITKLVVDLKSEIEKIREQAQNIE